MESIIVALKLPGCVVKQKSTALVDLVCHWRILQALYSFPLKEDWQARDASGEIFNVRVPPAIGCLYSLTDDLQESRLGSNKHRCHQQRQKPSQLVELEMQWSSRLLSYPQGKTCTPKFCWNFVDECLQLGVRLPIVVRKRGCLRQRDHSSPLWNVLQGKRHQSLLDP